MKKYMMIFEEELAKEKGHKEVEHYDTLDSKITSIATVVIDREAGKVIKDRWGNVTK